MVAAPRRMKPLDLFRMDDFSDPYGTASSHLFGIANAVHFHAGTTPKRWDLHNPTDPDECWPDARYSDAIAEGEISIEGAIRAFDIIWRYHRMIKHLGLDY